jgi:outer membrane protein assembly factor BamB
MIGPDGTIYVGGDGIHAVWADGTLRWKLATAEHVASRRRRSADDGTVYAGSPGRRALRGGSRRHQALGGPHRRRPRRAAGSIGDDGTIYVGSDDKTLLRDAPRRARWRWKAHHRRRRSAAAPRRPTTARSTSAATTAISTRSRPPAR